MNQTVLGANGGLMIKAQDCESGDFVSILGSPTDFPYMHLHKTLRLKFSSVYRCLNCSIWSVIFRHADHLQLPVTSNGATNTQHLLQK